jgi:hypothetical protein
MKSRLVLRVICAFLLGTCLPLSATTWYVRRDGGTRHSSLSSKGQCDGKTDAAYPGKGTNQHCAFNDVRWLWQDGSYSANAPFPGWGWVIAGGDTVIIRGSIGTGVSWRVGWNNANGAADPDGFYYGIQGDPYNSGAPPPPSGTATQHTRILGENFASCHSASAKTQIHGGWAVLNVLNLSGSSYVDVACLDITDFSACGRAAQSVGCGGTQDFAQNGIVFSNTSTHDSLTDVRVHGMAANGIYGPTGDGVVMDYIDILGNASSGWNSDSGNGTGKGTLSVSHFKITGNGCAEEFPIVHPIPYGDCTDQDHGGYGDGFGTATLASEPPGWQVTFDQGEVSYNTQDGLDALHISGAGSSMTVSHTLAYGSMGQQIKVGGASVALTNNVIFGNCTAMRQAIPGFPPGFNAKLDLFCRAGDTAVLIYVSPSTSTVYQDNTLYSAGNIGLEVEYTDPGKQTGTETIKYDRNIFVGFPGGDGQNPTPIYGNTDLKMFTNPGASFSNNVTYRPRGNWKCPATSLHESAGSCSNPHLKDETWHPYGYGDVSPVKAPDKATDKSSPQSGPMSSSQDEQDRSLRSSRTSIVVKSVGAAILVTSVWGGLRYFRDRETKS